MRLPRCCSQHEHAVLEHTLKLILGGDSRLISTELSRPMLEITLADCPTSRLHSQLVASWFGSQIAFLANTGEHRHGTLPAYFLPALRPACGAPVTGHCHVIAQARASTRPLTCTPPGTTRCSPSLCPSCPHSAAIAPCPPVCRP